MAVLQHYPLRWYEVPDAQYTYYKGPYVVIACPKCTRIIQIGNINDPSEDAYKVVCQCGLKLRYKGVIEIER